MKEHVVQYQLIAGRGIRDSFTVGDVRLYASAKQVTSTVKAVVDHAMDQDLRPPHSVFQEEPKAMRQRWQPFESERTEGLQCYSHAVVYAYVSFGPNESQIKTRVLFLHYESADGIESPHSRFSHVQELGSLR